MACLSRRCFSNRLRSALETREDRLVSGVDRHTSQRLPYEVTGYDEGGEQEFRRQHVRAEFEYTCNECQATLRTLPADCRDYYDELAVLETERRAALRGQLRQLGRRCRRARCAPATRLLSARKRWTNRGLGQLSPPRDL